MIDIKVLHTFNVYDWSVWRWTDTRETMTITYSTITSVPCARFFPPYCRRYCYYLVCNLPSRPVLKHRKQHCKLRALCTVGLRDLFSSHNCAPDEHLLSPRSQPWRPSQCLLLSRPVLIPHRSGIMQCLSFCVRLLSLNIRPPGSSMSSQVLRTLLTSLTIG